MTEMPIAANYKGVGLHAGQSAKRLARVKRELDKVGNISDLAHLSEIAADVAWSPEGRLYAAAKCLAGLRRVTERRELRPDIDAERVEACTAGLASLTWAHPQKHCCLLDPDDGRAVMRDRPLDGAE